MAKASLWSEHELHIYKSTLGPLTSIITQYTIGEALATDMAEAVEWATRPLGLVEVFLWVKLFNINLRWEWLVNKLRCGIRASADDDVSEKKIKMGPASNDSNCKFIVYVVEHFMKRAPVWNFINCLIRLSFPVSGSRLYSAMDESWFMMKCGCVSALAKNILSANIIQ